MEAILMMKRFSMLTIMGLVLIGLVFSSCGKKKEIVPEAPPIDTTTKAEEPPPTLPPTPPPPPPKLQESQLMTVHFDFDKFNLRDDARASLDNNFNLLSEFPDVMVKIEGHCDERGTVEYNLSLGEKRAKATMDYLIGLGVSESRMSIISYGKERPIDNASNEDAWTKNRRSEFRIVSQ